MKRKHIFSKIIIILAAILFLFPILEIGSSQASVEYKDIYPELSEAEKEEVSLAMYWLYKQDYGYHYRDGDSQEKAAIFTAMEQARANFHDRKVECHWDNYNPRTNWARDPLHAIEGPNHDKVEADGVDWYLKNFWNIDPSRSEHTYGDYTSAYYHDGYYYKFYHNFPDFNRPVVEKLYDLGNDYYLVDYAIAFDNDWDSWFGTYYAVLKKKQVEGKSMYSAIYNQNLHNLDSFERRSISRAQALKEAFPNQVAKKKIDISIDNKEIQSVEKLGKAYLDTYERIMVPVRLVSENLGHEVGWIEETRTITIDNDIYISMDEEDKQIFIKSLDKYIKMDTKAEIKEDRTYLPVRYIVEALGHKLEYENKKDAHEINILKNQGSFGTSTVQ